jgi:trimethylamine--corrinoid protein Co-methyltransferase
MKEGFTRKFKPLEILTDNQIEDLHKTTLDVLQATGIRIESEKALKLLERSGCKVDYNNKRAYFPPALVEECLRKAPSNFRIKARNPKNDLSIGGNTFYYNAGMGMNTIDLDTWEPRTATMEENYEGVTVLDALDSVHLIPWYTPYFNFKDVPPVMSMLESLVAKLWNSSKVVGEGYSNDCEIFTIEIAKAMGIDLVNQCASSAPLTYYSDAIEAVFRYVEAGFPVCIVTGTIFGGTGPVTIAGSLVTSNAEIMAGVVITQLLKPGTRIGVLNAVYPQNMRTGSVNFGQIGISLYSSAFNQIWRKYGIPIWDGDQAFTNSKRIDYQCGYEKSIMTVISALSGAHLLFLHGGLYGELSFHPILAILEDDIANMAGRFIEGIEINRETLALDLINDVGPIPGFYLNKAHTREWWRKEQFIPKAADGLTYPEWMKIGKKSSFDYAKERMQEILKTHKVDPPLTDSQKKSIREIVEEARNYYSKKGKISKNEMKIYRKITDHLYE